MAKAKVKKESTYIDMTAMTDVAFLLLTFFMLSATARPDEPVTVDMPSSISETKLPDANTITILVGSEGKAFLDFAGTHTRRRLIDAMDSEYGMQLEEKEKDLFAVAGPIGTPLKDMKKWLGSRPDIRKEMMEGIPKDSSNNELGPWIQAARVAQFREKQEGTVTGDYVIVVKADAETPYPAIEEVIHTLTDFNVNKFNLITNLEADPNKANAAKSGGG